MTLHPPTTIPKVDLPNILHSQLKEFYNFCGGLLFWSDTDIQTCISTPKEFILANDFHFPSDFLHELRNEDPNSDKWRSNSWYVLAELRDGNTVIIDLHPERYGYCYGCMLGDYRHVLPDFATDDMPIIATSPFEFIERTIAYNGEEFYWESDDFTPYGYAFD